MLNIGFLALHVVSTNAVDFFFLVFFFFFNILSHDLLKKSPSNYAARRKIASFACCVQGNAYQVSPSHVFYKRVAPCSSPCSNP